MAAEDKTTIPNSNTPKPIKRATPLNTLGMGNPMFPICKSRGDIGNTGADFHKQISGSGDC